MFILDLTYTDDNVILKHNYDSDYDSDEFSAGLCGNLDNLDARILRCKLDFTSPL